MGMKDEINDSVAPHKWSRFSETHVFYTTLSSPDFFKFVDVLKTQSERCLEINSLNIFKARPF